YGSDRSPRVGEERRPAAVCREEGAAAATAVKLLFIPERQHGPQKDNAAARTTSQVVRGASRIDGGSAGMQPRLELVEQLKEIGMMRFRATPVRDPPCQGGRKNY
ncbi:hypothetical protein AbraIFM66950_003090, partial [Aspergillus brasiliensis]